MMGQLSSSDCRGLTIRRLTLPMTLLVVLLQISSSALAFVPPTASSSSPCLRRNVIASTSTPSSSSSSPPRTISVPPAFFDVRPLASSHISVRVDYDGHVVLTATGNVADSNDVVLGNNKNEGNNKRSKLRGFLSSIKPRAALSALGRRRRLRNIATTTMALFFCLDLINPTVTGATAVVSTSRRQGGINTVSLAKGTMPAQTKDTKSSSKRGVVVVAAAAAGAVYGCGLIGSKSDDDTQEDENGGSETEAERSVRTFNEIMGTDGSKAGKKGDSIQKDLARQARELKRELNKEADEVVDERIQMELKAAERKMGLDSAGKKGGMGFGMPSSSSTNDDSSGNKADKKAVEIDEAAKQAGLRRINEEQERKKKEEAQARARADVEKKLKEQAEMLEKERSKIERQAAQKAAEAAEKERLEKVRETVAQKARVAEAERALQRQREEEAARLAAQKKKEAQELEKAEEAKRIEAKKVEAEQKWIKERMNKAEAQTAMKQMQQSTSDIRKQPETPEEAEELKAKYASMPLEERAFNILLDLGMVTQTPDPSDPNYDSSQDDDIAPENIYRP